MSTSFFEHLCDRLWHARQEVHGRWPDDGPYANQPDELKDWVRAEVRGVLMAMRELPHEVRVAMVAAATTENDKRSPGLEGRIVAGDGRLYDAAHRAMLDAILAGDGAPLSQPADWQPIATAPHGHILVFGQPKDLVIEGEAVATYRGPFVCTAHWDEVDQSFVVDGGSWLGPFIEPTHWMPLPEPPSA